MTKPPYKLVAKLEQFQADYDVKLEPRELPALVKAFKGSAREGLAALARFSVTTQRDSK